MAPRGLTSELACCQRRRSPDKAEMVFDSDPLEAPRTRETGRPSGTRQSSVRCAVRLGPYASVGVFASRPGACAQVTPAGAACAMVEADRGDPGGPAGLWP